MFISTSSGCLSCVIHVVYPIDIIYNISVTGMFCVCLVKVRDIRTLSKTLQFIGSKYRILSLLHVSALIGHHRADLTTKLPPLMYFYSRTHIGLLGPKHVAYWKQNVALQ